MAKKSKAKGSLFNALSSQQARLKKKSQAENAAQQRAKQEASKGKGKGKNKAPPPRMLQPFAATDRILLIGEGNFSFARALVCNPPDIPASSCGSASTSASATLEFLPPANVVATAFDTEEECYEKYPEAAEIVREIKEKGSKVIFGVDATNLHKCSALKGRRFDRVVFNFPHTGKGIADQERNILSNQDLILGFLRSAQHVLESGDIPSFTSSKADKSANDDEDQPMPSQEIIDEFQLRTLRGTVLITLRNVSPYTLWGVTRLAKSPPPPANKAAPPYPRYRLLRSFVFHRKLWEGYSHRLTKGERGVTGVGGEDRTWEFCLADVPEPSSREDVRA